MFSFDICVFGCETRIEFIGFRICGLISGMNDELSEASIVR